MKNFLILLTTIIFLSLTLLVSAENTGSLMITEVMPNPSGLDSDYEWIELTNFSTETIDLATWNIDNKTLPNIHIGPNEIIILARNEQGFYQQYHTFGRVEEFNFSLPNSGDTLILSNSNDSSQFNYGSSTENISYELLEGGCQTIQKHPDSNSAGSLNNSCFTPTTSPTPIIQEYANKIIISNLDPAPDNGSEWLELTNNETYSVNLKDWIIEDDSDNKYTIPETSLNAGQSIKIYPSSVSLNNGGDTIYLYTPNGMQVDIFTYDESINDPQQIEKKDVEPDTVQSNIRTSVTEDTTQKEKQPEYQVPILYKIGEY